MMCERKHEIFIEEMVDSDIASAVALVTLAMNSDEGRWAKTTMQYHFECRCHRIEDGRKYYVWRSSGIINGLVGLHHYLWGPEENVWLAWFAVHPEFQRKGIGRKLLGVLENVLIQFGYTKLLVETYEHSDFDKARSFYLATGFSEVGRIREYLSDGSDMVVYRKLMS